MERSAGGKQMKIDVSNGEVVDRWTILTIKLERIEGEPALTNIKREHELLSEHVRQIELTDVQIDALLTVNIALWDVENRLRTMEANQMFDQDFVEAARSVYLLNDDRARLKREINATTNSLLVEEKSYTLYPEETEE